jgi:hypothetical protein
MQTITTIGLDIAKSVFQVHGVDAGGQVVIRRQLKRRQIVAFSRRFFLLTGSRPHMALFGPHGLGGRCLLLRAKPTSRSHARTSQFDPERTSMRKLPSR